MATHRPITLLHISDIQVEGPDEKMMLSRLLDDLEEMVCLYGLKPQLIVASGDLAQKGKKDEFDNVAEFLNEAAKRLGLEAKDIIVVPGNHDINWESCKIHFASPLANPLPPYEKKWNEFIDFFKKLYGEHQPAGYVFTYGQPWTFYKVPSIRTVFAGLNSTWHERHDDPALSKAKNKKFHYGYIDTGQYKWFEEKLQDYKNKEWLRIAVLHHNLVPTVADDSNLHDKSDFEKHILPHVNLVLHGHTHQGNKESNDEVPILSTGSASVSKELLPLEIPNQYQIIQIWRGHYQRWARSYSKVRGNWIGDCSISTDGNSWYARKTKEFKHIDKTFPPNDEGFTQHAKGFIEAGDSVTAAAIISRGLKVEALKDPKEYFSLRQKFGVYNDADLSNLDREIEEKAAKKDQLDKDGYDQYLDLQVIRLKLYSQKEEFDKVDEQFEKLMLDSRLKDEKRRGIIHRKAIHTAIKDGFEKAAPIFLQAEEISNYLNGHREPGTPKNEHSPLTTKVLRTFAEFFCNMEPPSAETTQATLAKAQLDYLGAGYVHSIGQAFPLKSAIQTLFAEAAVLLYSDLDDLKGLSRLFAAHLLVSRYVLTPDAEGYKEQLSMIHYPNPRIQDESEEFKKRQSLRKLLEDAMYSDGAKRRIFLEAQFLIKNRYSIFRPMWEIFDLIPIQCPQPCHWKEFQDFLARHDQAMSSVFS